ncbi:MAG: GTPase ObgE [Nitrospirae bacterium]|nr:GTPase ObgE [Nitrospirota bacterium]
MKFVDRAEIRVKAGHGGKGCVSFRREKYVEKGGPNGGDGGRGGHIIFKASSGLSTLLDFRYKRQYAAKKGEGGKGQQMHGKNAEDLILPVPVGTIIKDAVTDETIADLTKDGQEFIAAKGGRGGLGNIHYKGPTRQAPRYAQPGEDGEERELVLELKLIADVGLIGLPNAGKSTLISALSAARPKIADYPFTTLKPALGVVKFGEYGSFVIADIPGLIEGAHEGTGLGFQFLRHVERTSILLHLVDISEMAIGDPVENFKKIQRELELYSPELIKKPLAVAGTKLDIKGDGKNLDKLAQYCKDNNYDFFPVCAVTGAGLNKLTAYLGKKVKKHKK